VRKALQALLVRLAHKVPLEPTVKMVPKVPPELMVKMALLVQLVPLVLSVLLVRMAHKVPQVQSDPRALLG